MCGCGGSWWKDACNQEARSTSRLVNQPLGRACYVWQIMLKKVIKNHTKSHKKLSTKK
jgi:hypothetical protein